MSGLASIGYVLSAIGIWIIYCGWNGLNPLTTVQKIIKNPAQAQKIVAASKQAQATTPSSGAGGVVAFARAQIGKPYVLGGTGPNQWDCSGLAMMAYRSVGINIPRLVSGQLAVGRRISRKQDLQPGDLLFPLGVAHVQIYSGGGNIIEAPKPGTPVRERGMWGFSGDAVTATRPGA